MPSTAHQVSPKISLSSLFKIHSKLQQPMVPQRSLQSGSSKQSVLMQPLSGGGDVRAESVVQRGKQGSGDQSPVTSPVSLQRAVLQTTKTNTSKCILIIGTVSY